MALGVTISFHHIKVKCRGDMGRDGRERGVGLWESFSASPEKRDEVMRKASPWFGGRKPSRALRSRHFIVCVDCIVMMNPLSMEQPVLGREGDVTVS